MHITAVGLAVLAVAPVLGLSAWLASRHVRGRFSWTSVLIATGVLLEVYGLIAVLVLGAPLAIAAPVWAIAEYALNILLPGARRRRVSRHG